MEKIIIDLEVKSQKGVKEVEKLNKEISNTSKETADASKTLDGFTGGAVSKFKGLKGSIGSVVKGFKSLKFAILASGIGALLLAVVTTWRSSSGNAGFRATPTRKFPPPTTTASCRSWTRTTFPWLIWWIHRHLCRVKMKKQEAC